MMSASDPLREATRAYVEAAMALLRNRCEPAPDEEDGLYEWVRVSDDSFRLQPSRRYWWHDCLRNNRADLHALTECATLIEQLETDVEILPLLDELVGVAGSSHLVERYQVTDHLIWKLGEETGSGELSAATFDAEYSLWDAELRAGHIRGVTIAPLIGYVGPDKPVQLARGVVIDRLSDQEIARLLRVGFLPAPFGARIHGMASVTTTHGLRVVRELERSIGGSGGDHQAEWATKHQALIEQIEDTLIALRIFKGGRVGSSGWAGYYAAWILAGSTTFEPLADFPLSARPMGYQYELASDDAAQLPAFLQRYLKAKAVPAVNVAMRRFAYAADRSRADDRIIDLLIAAEALFGGGGDRLAIRGAWLLEPNPAKRRAMLTFLKHAYAVRSQIAHGAPPNATNMHLVNSTAPIAIQKFADEIERLVRLAIHIAIDRIDGTGTFHDGAAWDALILGQ
jgi:hypothetical protein